MLVALGFLVSGGFGPGPGGTNGVTAELSFSALSKVACRKLSEALAFSEDPEDMARTLVRKRTMNWFVRG